MDRRKLRNRFATVVVGLSLLVGWFATPAAAQEDPGKVPGDPPVNAAAGCRATSCNGKDPEAMSCDQVHTLYEFSYLNVRIQLRKSDECHAAWVRVISPQHYNTVFGQIRAYDNVRASDSQDLIGVYGVQATAGTHWTRMWSFTYWVKACESDWVNDTPPNRCGGVR